jgi:ParB-like chromosome segregation protein Spo0J
MAVDFSIPHTRTSEYLIAPEDIVVKPDLNGRHKLPDIDWLIESFARFGQLQPIDISAEEGKAVLRAGHSRWRAAIEGKKRGVLPPEFKLRCSYIRCTPDRKNGYSSDAMGFLANIHENIVRNPAEAIDDAYNIAKLEQWSMTHEEIAKIYRQDVKWVEQRLALIDLVPEAQKAVADGRMKLSAAAHFAKLAKQVQSDKMKAKGDEGKITARDAKPEDAPAKPKAKRSDNATVSLRAILESAVNEGKYPDGIMAGTATEDFCSYLLDVLNGLEVFGGGGQRASPAG